jgi:hypothetical protein
MISAKQEEGGNIGITGKEQRGFRVLAVRTDWHDFLVPPRRGSESGE